jgi:transcriptional regulator with XRE-family HTH domain
LIKCVNKNTRPIIIALGPVKAASRLLLGPFSFSSFLLKQGRKKKKRSGLKRNGVIITVLFKEQMMQELYESIGAKIKELRKTKNMRIDDLSSAAGMNRNTLVNIERGANTTIEKLALLANALEVPIHALFPVGEAKVVSADSFHDLYDEYKDLRVRYEDLLIALRKLTTE